MATPPPRTLSFASFLGSSASCATDAFSLPSPPPPPPPRTLTEALSPVAAPPSAYARYAPYLIVTARFLGEPPSFYPVLGLAPSALATHVGLFARYFGVPAVDMRAPGALSPAHRRLAFLTASRAFGCDYCTAHACAFGDMLRGSSVSQAARRRQRPLRGRRPRGGDDAGGSDGGDEDGDDDGDGGGRGHAAVEGVVLDAEDPAATPAEAAILTYVTLAVMRPFPEHRRPQLHTAAVAVRAELGRSAFETLRGVVSFVGALNSMTDVLGAVLEPGAQRHAGTILPPRGAVVGDSRGGGWTPNDHHRNPTVKARGDATAAAAAAPIDGSGNIWGPPRAGAHEPSDWDDTTDDGDSSGSDCSSSGDGRGGGGGGLSKDTPPADLSWAAAKWANLTGLLHTLPAAAAGMRVEAELYAGIPSSIAPLYGWMVARMGAPHCQFLLRLRGVELVRGFCFALRENVLVEELPSIDRPGSGLRSPPGGRTWTVADRIRLLHVFACATGSAGLAAGAVGLATRSSGWPAAVAATDLAAFTAGSSNGAAGTAAAAARQLVRAAGSGLEAVAGPLVPQLTSAISPAGLVELASLVSFAEMWRRLELLFSRGGTGRRRRRPPSGRSRGGLAW